LAGGLSRVHDLSWGPTNPPRPNISGAYEGWGCGVKSWIWSVLANGATILPILHLGLSWTKLGS
jgi:hypothetical protein